MNPSVLDTQLQGHHIRTVNTEHFLFLSSLLSAALCRFIPRHADELELDVDDPLYVEEEEDDYWYRGYNMRTGERGIFPAFYAHEVIGQSKELLGELRDTSFLLCYWE